MTAQINFGYPWFLSYGHLVVSAVADVVEFDCALAGLVVTSDDANVIGGCTEAELAFQVVAALFQLATILMLAGLGGNMLSILVPYRIAPGSMKPTKMPAAAMIVMVICQMLFPVAIAPVFVPALAQLLWDLAGWPSVLPINLILSVVLAGVAAFAYWRALGPMGRLLQRRERKILEVLTLEVE